MTILSLTSMSRKLTSIEQDQAPEIIVSKLPPGYLYGLTTSRTSASVLGVAAGSARDSADTINLVLSGSLNKSLAAWSAGTGHGGLDTGAAANATWYFPFLIGTADGETVDILISTSPTAPSLPIGYTTFRRIGAFRTDGSAGIVAFSQIECQFFWSIPITDYSNFSGIGTSSMSLALSVPPLIGVEASFRASVFTTGQNTSILLRPLLSADVAISYVNANFYDQSSGGGVARDFRILTDGAGHIGARADRATTRFDLTTSGWTDRCGRDA